MRRAPLVAVAAAGVVLAGALFSVQDRLAQLLYHETVTAGSESLFLGARDVAELETLAKVHKTVFPHDYFLEDTTFSRLLDRVRRSDAPAREVLTREEYSHFEAVNLAHVLGLATSAGEPGYVVVTTTLRYGYDLTEVEPLMRAQQRDPAEDTGSLDSAVTIPPARLLSYDTEDLSRDSYPYSAVHLDADGWHAVATFVSGRLHQEDPGTDVIEAATSTGIALLEALTSRRFQIVAPEWH